MKKLTGRDKSYDVDSNLFLIDYSQWDENFAETVAGELKMGGLTDEHWRVIRFIRQMFQETGVCPVVSETCKALELDLKTLQELFPTGYLRGACLLAGISYKYGWVYYGEEPYGVSPPETRRTADEFPDKVYRVDLFGSLVDPSEWDEDYAVRRAYEANIRGGLTDKHWEIIHYLRNYYADHRKIPTIYDCCDQNRIDIDAFARLFPAGYHRGAVKIAGLPTFR